MRIILLALFLVAALPLAHAHPFTEVTSPDARNSGAVGLTQIWVKYSEEVELDFSSLKVYDGAGNQIDNRDTSYYLDERSLVVSTPPLEDGIYTVASKVLSKVDGHLVPDTFIFAVGSAVIDPALTEVGDVELVYLPEAGARFPGLVGQTVILGAAIAAMLVWGTQNKRPVRESMGAIRRIHHDKLMSVVGAALIAVFASNIMMLVVQTIRLESFSAEIFDTTFGTVWIARMVITGVMLALWFVVNQRRGLGRGGGAALMALSLALLWTSSQIGHGAASGEWAPLVLDYVHNLVAAAWIGGVAYLCLVLLPALSAADWWGRERMALLLIPRFSTVFVVGLGVVIITGPVLMWFLESDVGMISESIYGRLIMAKIAVAAAMVGLGGYLQVTSMRSAQESVDNKTVQVYGRMRKTLRVEMILGMVLLGVVAVLINGTLPAGEIQETEAAESAGLRLVEFTGNTKFEIDVEPYTTGLNGIYVRASNLDGSPVQDETGVRVKISNPERNISPVALDLENAGEVDGMQEYSGEAIFGFAGRWLVEVESQREEGANESVTLSLPVKPDIGTMVASITEYELPEPAGPLYPLYDGSGSIWVSDSSAPRLWKFDLESKEFESFRFDGAASVFLTMDGQGRIWFTDIPSEQIGYLEPETGAFTLIGIPELEPAESHSTMIFIEADRYGDIWVAVSTKDTILRYDVDGGTFERFSLAPRSLPFALAEGPDGSIWFTTTNSSRIGYIVPETGQIREFASEDPLANPESLLFLDGSIWISEHTGASLARFDPVLETFERVPLDVPGGLPFGTSLDRHGNIWIAQHTADVVVIYDPVAGVQKQVPVPTNGSFAQFATTDGDGNVWLAEQRGNKLAVGSTTDIPSSEVPARQAGGAALMYTELASPLMAAGILAASLFFVKSIRDRRMLEDLILSD